MSCPEKGNDIKYNEDQLIFKTGIFENVKWYKITSLLLFRGKKQAPNCNAV